MKKIDSRLTDDLFIIEYDPARIEPNQMIEVIAELDFNAREIGPNVATAKSGQAREVLRKSPLITAILKRAQRENKNVVLLFSGSFCGTCERLEKETISDPAVQSKLKGVLYRKVMVEEHPDAARQFAIDAIPQLRFLSPKGMEIGKDRGVITVARMLGHLESLDRER